MQSFREFLSADISTVLAALGVLVAMVFGVINAVRKTWQRILVIVIGVLILSLLLWNHYAMKRKNPPSDAYLSTSEFSSNTSADGSLQPKQRTPANSAQSFKTEIESAKQEVKPNSNQRTDNIAVTAKEMMQRDYVSIGEGYIVFPSSMGPYYTYGGTRYRYKEVCAYTQDGIILTGHKYVVDVD